MHRFTSLVRGLSMLALTIGFFAASALAQWPQSAEVDLPVLEGAGEQSVPHLVNGPDQSVYLGCYDNRSGNYDLVLQRLSASGEELWAHNGLPVSAEAQNSWVMDWSLLAADGDALVALNDLRSGGATIAIYRISPEGTLLWGESGITVTQSTGFLEPPQLLYTATGLTLVCWTDHLNDGSTEIRLQAYSEDGSPLYPMAGQLLHASNTESPGRPRLLSTSDGGFYMSFVENDMFNSDRQLVIQHFNSNAVADWDEPQTVFSTGTLPFGHDYIIKQDASDGVFLLWEAALGMSIYSYIQHFDLDGATSFSANGQRLSTDNNQLELYPQIHFDPLSETLLAVWRKTNLDQTQFGLFAQKFQMDGTRLWEEAGRVVEPLSGSTIDFLNLSASGDELMLSWITGSSAWADDVIRARMLDLEADLVWDTAALSSTLSEKSRLLHTDCGESGIRLAWTDERSGNPDIYAKSLRRDGSIGADDVALKQLGPSTRPDQITLIRATPNPFNPSTLISFELTQAGMVQVELFNMAGKHLQNLLQQELAAGQHEVVLEGRHLASGCYLCTFRSASSQKTMKILHVK